VNIVETLAVTGAESFNLTSGINEHVLAISGACLAARGVHPIVVVGYSYEGLLVIRDSEGEGFGSTGVIQHFVIAGMLLFRIERDMKLFESLNEVGMINVEYTFGRLNRECLTPSKISPMFSVIIVPIAIVFSLVTTPRISNSI
jgi:hypothetical protein